MSIISTIHLNSKDALYMNGNQASFIVNWDSVLHGKKGGKCRVYAVLQSQLQANNSTPPRTINASFSSSSSISYYGIPLATIEKKYINPTTVYLVAETKPNQGVTIETPTGQQIFNVNLI